MEVLEEEVIFLEIIITLINKAALNKEEEGEMAISIEDLSTMAMTLARKDIMITTTLEVVDLTREEKEGTDLLEMEGTDHLVMDEEEVIVLGEGEEEENLETEESSITLAPLMRNLIKVEEEEVILERT